MELRTYLEALRKHWLSMVLLTLLGILAGVGGYLLTPPVYSSSVTFYVSTPPTDNSNPFASGQFAQARVNSYVSLLESEQLALRVIREENLDLTAVGVMKKIKATAELNTVLVTAEVRDSTPDRSLKIAEGIARTFGEMVNELDNQNRKDAIVIINVVSGPTLAPYPVAPSLRIYGGLGLLAGTVLGMLLTVLREILDNTVHSDDVAIALVKAPVIGTIGYDAVTRRKPLLLRDSANSVRAESFRQLRTNLQFIDAAEKADVLLVTSAVPGEGKSVTAVNLALSFVEFGNRVLLIEADLRRPELSRYLGVEREIGLTNVLVGTVDPEDAVQEWGSDGLHVLPSGSVPPNPSELLGSNAMRDLMREFRLKFDKIVIDTPPLLPVTDAAVCSAVADGVILVIRSGKTHRSHLAASAQALKAVNARVLGTVMNMRKLNRSERRKYLSETYYDPEPIVWASSHRVETSPFRKGDGREQTEIR